MLPQGTYFPAFPTTINSGSNGLTLREAMEFHGELQTYNSSLYDHFMEFFRVALETSISWNIKHQEERFDEIILKTVCMQNNEVGNSDLLWWTLNSRHCCVLKIIHCEFNTCLHSLPCGCNYSFDFYKTST